MTVKKSSIHNVRKVYARKQGGMASPEFIKFSVAVATFPFNITHTIVGEVPKDVNDVSVLVMESYPKDGLCVEGDQYTMTFTRDNYDKIFNDGGWVQFCNDMVTAFGQK